MLDKTKIYDAHSTYSLTIRKNVKILYEDDISYYAVSLMRADSQKNGIRYSLKKHWYRLIEVQAPGKSDVCGDCPLLKIAKKYGSIVTV